MTSKSVALALYDEAVAAASADRSVPPNLPPLPTGRLVLFGAGKAGAAMVRAAIRHYRAIDPKLEKRLAGVAVTRHGYGCDTSPLPVREVGHPIPDAGSIAASEEMLRLAHDAKADDLVLMLLSGGASANLTLPVASLTLADKQAVARALLRSGANISEINTVRRHLSRIKGGKLAAAVSPGAIVTLAISDVPGDLPTAIGSGPTVGDPTTLADAREVIDRFKIDLAPHIKAALSDPANETLKPGNPACARSTYKVVATAAGSLKAAGDLARKSGYEPIVLGDRVEGEAREVAAQHAAMAREHANAGRKVAIISGGELTVTIVGNGRGGPNQEYALALALAVEGDKRLSGLAGDTDGTDGGGGLATDPAGAYVDSTSTARMRAKGRDPVADLRNNNSTAAFEVVGDLLNPGPTLTNVSDFRVVLVDIAKA